MRIVIIVITVIIVAVVVSRAVISSIRIIGAVVVTVVIMSDRVLRSLSRFERRLCLRLLLSRVRMLLVRVLSMRVRGRFSLLRMLMPFSCVWRVLVMLWVRPIL